MEMFPQGFNGFVGSPQCGNAGPIAFQFRSCDDTISGMEMDEHGGHRDIGESENVIIESGKVEAVNSSEKLIFELLMQGGSEGEFGKLSFEYMDKFAENKLVSTSWHNGSITRMGRELESNASKGEVVSSGHDKTKVTMGTTSVGGRDGMHIGINFLCEEVE